MLDICVLISARTKHGDPVLGEQPILGVSKIHNMMEFPLTTSLSHSPPAPLPLFQASIFGLTMPTHVSNHFSSNGGRFTPSVPGIA